MKSWRVWLVGLTCSLGWISAIATYLINWSIGWFFCLIMIATMGIVWIAELDLRDLHRVQVIQLERRLKEAQETTADRQRQLDLFFDHVRRLTDDFLDEETSSCKGCGNHSVWFFTPFKFNPGVHRKDCSVAELRSMIENPSLWLPGDFQNHLEQKWLDSPTWRDNPVYAEFFTRKESKQ